MVDQCGHVADCKIIEALSDYHECDGDAELRSARATASEN